MESTNFPIMNYYASTWMVQMPIGGAEHGAAKISGDKQNIFNAGKNLKKIHEL